jgi:hypothetical protein
MDSGRSNVSDYRKFFANGTQNIDAMVAIGKKWGIKGWSMDLEPQVGSPASTKADAALYAKWLSQAKIAFNKEGMRLTVAVAQWATMLNDYKLLAPSVDRILDMETYNADSYKGWLNGDNFGGYYNKLLTAGATKVAPGMGCWNASCGKHTCWTVPSPPCPFSSSARLSFVFFRTARTARTASTASTAHARTPLSRVFHLLRL